MVEITPFTLVVNSKELVDVEIVKVLLLMIVVVDIEPPIFEVNVFVFEVNELGTVIEATFKLAIFAFVSVDEETISSEIVASVEERKSAKKLLDVAERKLAVSVSR